MRTRRATSARPSRPSRVVKELMAALMRFPAAVYQFSFVNVAPFFPPSVGDPLARSRHFNSWMELIHYAEPSVFRRVCGGVGFRPPALRAPIHLAAATRGISGVLYHSLYTLPSVMRCHAAGRSSRADFRFATATGRVFLQLCACPNRVNSRRCTFFARSDDEDVANKQRQFPRRLCCYVALFVPLCAPVKQ